MLGSEHSRQLYESEAGKQRGLAGSSSSRRQQLMAVEGLGG